MNGKKPKDSIPKAKPSGSANKRCNVKEKDIKKSMKDLFNNQ